MRLVEKDTHPRSSTLFSIMRLLARSTTLTLTGSALNRSLINVEADVSARRMQPR